ncbi:MAG: aldo/keto reductase [Anaerolineae bacterium]
MPTKRLRSGFEMPIFGMGTWRMGGDYHYDPSNDDEADIRAIRAAIEIGITHIDTAETYAEGHAERLVGQAIKGYDREKLFIVSKVSPEHLRYDDLIASAKGSLERLETDYLDLYLIHHPNPNIRIVETMRAKDVLVDEGLVKNIGVSNFTVERLEEAQAHTKNRIVANQLHLNLIYREPERKGLLEYCQKNDVMFVAWRPMQKGLLAKRGIKVLDEMCEKYGRSPAQIAINWLVSQPNVVTLSKMRNVEHIKENLGAIGWQMDEEDIDRLRRDFPNQQDVSDTVPLI